MTRSSQQWSVRAGALAIAAVLIAQGPPITGQRAESKLTTMLADLARVVPQDVSERGAGSWRVRSAARSLPASVQDAVQGRQLRIDEDGSVQVYILLQDVTSERLQQLTGAGVTIEIRRWPRPPRPGPRAGDASAARRVAGVRRFRPRADVRPHSHRRRRHRGRRDSCRGRRARAVRRQRHRRARRRHLGRHPRDLRAEVRRAMRRGRRWSDRLARSAAGDRLERRARAVDVGHRRDHGEVLPSRRRPGREAVAVQHVRVSGRGRRGDGADGGRARSGARRAAVVCQCQHQPRVQSGRERARRRQRRRRR